MPRNLKMEVFASKEIVNEVELHVYRLHSQRIENSFSVIRGAVWKIRNHCNVGVFEDGKHIFTTEQVDESVPGADFTIEYLGKKG